MITLHPQYINDNSGQQLVVLLRKEYDIIIEQLENVEDVKLYDKAKKGKQEFIDAKDAFNEIETKRNL